MKKNDLLDKAYDSISTPKMLFLFVFFALGFQTSLAQTTRFWVGGTTGNFNSASNWSLTSGGTPLTGTIAFPNTDIFIVDGNSLATVTIVSASSNANNKIGKLQVTGGRTLILSPVATANRILTIQANGADALLVASGSTLIIKGLDAANDRNMTVTLNAGTGTATASISGKVQVTKDVAATSTGVFTTGGDGMIDFLANSEYDHNVNAGAIPVATWNISSLCKITGTTDDLPTNASLTQSFGNREWNATQQDTDFNVTTQSFFTPTVGTTLTLASTGAGANKLSYTGNHTYYGNTIISGGKYILNAANANRNFVMGGDLTVSGGYLSVSEFDSAIATRVHTLTVNGNLLINGGVLDVCNSLANGRLFLDKNIIISSGALAYSQASVTGSSGVFFQGTAGIQDFIWSGGTLSTSTTGIGRHFYYRIISPLTALNETYSGNTPQSTINGSEGTIATGYAAWPSSGTLIKNVTVNNSAGVTLTTNKVLFGDLNVVNGVFDLGGFTINRAIAGGSIVVNNGAGINVGGTNSFPSNYSTQTLGLNSTINYNGANQNLAVINAPGYGNLTLSGTGSKYFSSDLLIANNLTVNPGAVFTVTSGLNLRVGNLIVNNAGAANFVVENNANLIQTNAVANTGDITVRRDSNALSRLDYTMWSSPVDGQQLQAFSPVTLADRFYIYNPVTDLYNTIVPTSNFVMGTGYLIRMPNTAVAAPATEIFNGVFTGIPNNGPVSITVTSGTYNAIGNPYPSTMDANLFMSGNGITSGVDALYFWRKINGAAGSAYATYTTAGGTASPSSDVPNGIIQVGQGFIVKSTSTSLVFDNSMRVANNDDQFFKNTVDKSRIWLNLTSANGFSGQMMLAYMDGATTGIDAGIDGKYFNDSQTAITSVISAQEFVIQGRPLPFAATDVVQLGFKSVTAGTFIIAIDHVDGLFGNGQVVYLKDNLTNITHNLSEGSYTFVTQPGVFNSRFEIVFQTVLAVNKTVFNENNVVVYKQDKALIVDAANTMLDNVKVYDIAGRLLMEEKNINATQIKLYPETNNQVLIVEISSDKKVIVTKKVIN